MEVEPAAAAAVQNEGTNSSSAMSHARSATMCVLSLLFVWLATTTLRSIPAGDEKEEDLLVSAAVVRGLSPLISAYLFSLTAALQGIKGSGTMFLRVTCLLLLADAVARLINAPSASAAAMFLVTVHSAVTLGGALAVCRQKEGTEVTAAAAAMSASPYWSHAEERHVQSCRTAVAASVALVVVVTFGTMALATWLAPPTPEKKEGESHVGLGELELFGLMISAGPLLVGTRQLMLDGNPLQVDDDTFFVSMVVGFVGWIVAMVVASVLVGGNGPGIFIWGVALTMAGYFGYGRAVEAQFEELMAVKRSEPRTAVDASGLLVGRDEEDACSAHIDACTSVCLDCAVRAGCRC